MTINFKMESYYHCNGCQMVFAKETAVMTVNEDISLCIKCSNTLCNLKQIGYGLKPIRERKRRKCMTPPNYLLLSRDLDYGLLIHTLGATRNFKDIVSDLQVNELQMSVCNYKKLIKLNKAIFKYWIGFNMKCDFCPQFENTTNCAFCEDKKRALYSYLNGKKPTEYGIAEKVCIKKGDVFENVNVLYLTTKLRK